MGAIINIYLPVYMRLPGKKDQKKVDNLGVACYTYYVLSKCIQFVWKKRGRNFKKSFFFIITNDIHEKFFLATCMSHGQKLVLCNII